MDIMDLMGMGGGLLGGGLAGFGRAIVAYIIAVILGIAGAIVAYCLFSRPKKRPLFLHKPRLLLLHDFLNYKKMWTPWFNKLLYLIVVCVMNLCFIVDIFTKSFFGALFSMIIANILVRGLYELITVSFSIHSNLNLITDMLLGRERDDGVSAEQVFGGIGDQLKAKQQELRERAEAKRAQEEAELRRAQDTERRAREEAERRERNEQQAYQPPPEQAAPPAPAKKRLFCTKCGNPLDGDGAFCPKCGAPV